MKYNTETLLRKIGCHHKYQIVITIIYVFIGTFTDYLQYNMPSMTSPPTVTFTDNKGIFHREILKYE